MLSDLRESGSIEQDADVVAFIYREDVYTTRDDWEKRNPTEQYPENIAQLIFAKHRNGPRRRRWPVLQGPRIQVREPGAAGASGVHVLAWPSMGFQEVPCTRPYLLRFSVRSWSR